MVSETHREHRTNFTLSIEAAEGITTGISAHDRAHTVIAAVKPDARPEDLRQPGHIFPVMAQPGGVLTRAGHTEAGCDLARLAGLDASAVIVEIMNDDGTMARRPDLEAFAAQHGLKIGTIADLIRYRLRQERSVERIAEQQVETEFGEFQLLAYEDHVHRDVHLALVRGNARCDAAAAGARASHRHAVGPARRARRRPHLDAARGDAAHRRGRHRHRHRAARPRDAARAGRRGAARSGSAPGTRARPGARRRCCAPTASARRSSRIWASRACRCCPRPSNCRASRLSGSRSPATSAELTRLVYSRAHDRLPHQQHRAFDARAPSRRRSSPRASMPRSSISSSPARRDAWREHGGDPARLLLERVPGAFELPLAAQDVRRERRASMRSSRWAA